MHTILACNPFTKFIEEIHEKKGGGIGNQRQRNAWINIDDIGHSLRPRKSNRTTVRKDYCTHTPDDGKASNTTSPT